MHLCRWLSFYICIYSIPDVNIVKICVCISEKSVSLLCNSRYVVADVYQVRVNVTGIYITVVYSM
jgi:hypothetical protein